MTPNATNVGRDLTLAATIDDRWVPHFATCVASIAGSHRGESVRFLMLQGPDLSTASVRSLRDFVREHGMEFEPIRVSESLHATLPPTSHMFSPLVWYRLLLPELAPEVDKVIFLDADTLVLQSLKPLLETDLADSVLAAVSNANPSEHVLRLGLDPNAPYFNAGVMVMNLAAMREEHFGRRGLALGRERHADFIFNDQDVLNVLADGRWKQLHPRWNAMSHLWLRPHTVDRESVDLMDATASASPAIVHFEGFQTVKPWFYRSLHPHRFLYRQYRAQTPWPLEGLEGVSVVAAFLRRLPLRWQYAIANAKGRAAARRSARDRANTPSTAS